MDTIHDRDKKDITEAKEMKKRRQEYMEEKKKKGLNDQDNHDSVVTHLEPGVWGQVGLRSITMNKASGDDANPAELFKILKDNAVKVLHSICQQIWKTQQWPQDW